VSKEFPITINIGDGVLGIIRILNEEILGKLAELEARIEKLEPQLPINATPPKEGES
jgi:hypothetical protein